MSPVHSIAASGLTAQSQRLEAVARSVASLGATQPASSEQVSVGTQVRIGALPVGATIEESMVTLVEAKHAYRMNAAVIETAGDMLDSLLDTLDA